MPEEQWCSLGFTYDGKYIRACIDGVLDPVRDKRTDSYFTSEGPGGKDLYDGDQPVPITDNGQPIAALFA